MTTGEYPVYLRGERAGTVRISKEGIRYIVDAFCPHTDGLVRLSLYGGGREGYLGVMQPENGGLRLRRSLSRSDAAAFPQAPAYAAERGGARAERPAPKPPRERERDTLWHPDGLGLLFAEENGETLCAVPRRFGMACRGTELPPRVIEGEEYRVFALERQRGV